VAATLSRTPPDDHAELLPAPESGGGRHPARRLLGALIYVLACAWLAVTLALQGPWLGLSMKAHGESLTVTHVRGPAAEAGIERGAVVLALEAPANGAAIPGVVGDGVLRLELQAIDIAEEPDMVERYAELDAFFERQGRIATLVQARTVNLEWRSPTGDLKRVALTPAARPLSDLPLRFWFQLAVSAFACLVATWVWVLRPTDWGARLFGLTGLLLPLSAMSAGVYGARELALPQPVFAALSAVNHGSSALWGAAFVGIFLMYPRPLANPRALVALFIAFGAWWWIGQMRWVEGLDAGIRLLLVAELALAMGCAAWQWRRSRGSPLERASLRWFLWSLLLGSSLFIASIIVTVVLGWLPPLPQGYAFGFFVLIYAGIALGLRRYPLFDLGPWAWRLLAGASGAMAVLAVDALLIVTLDWSQATALGVSLWICGALYFPARQFLWARWVRRPERQLHELMPDLVEIAFQPLPTGREQRWDALIDSLFDPLRCEIDPDASKGVTLEGARVVFEGLALRIPPCAGMAGRVIHHAARGQRLFGARDAAFIDAVCTLMERAAQGREAHERGAAAERRRIAQDMHDDVGARLLMLMHRAPTSDMADLARSAMSDLRTALSALEAGPVPLADALADWRAEATQRCEAAGVDLDWQGPKAETSGEGLMLSARHRMLFERALRESLSNALRHGHAQQVQVLVDCLHGALTLTLRNDGTPTDPSNWIEGRGLRGMRQRLREFQGTLTLGRDADGCTEVLLRLPLEEAG
jgi:signal transduction histidine kinase